jgi:hypothetical protein
MTARRSLSESPQNPFSTLPTRTSLLRTRKGRPLLPPPEALNANNAKYYFSDDDLNAILVEAHRQRRNWRIGHCIKLSMLSALGVWLGWLWWVVATTLK